jgi:crotonobetainyl-CoA:carnitine CoA-transferase CaiB-like acyl-CoA transferase
LELTGGPLEGIKVVDSATIFAGPVLATLLGDFGADVIKVEHPDGDSLRTMGWEKDGVSFWWAFANRNKRGVTIRLSDPRGAQILKELVADADVYIENFRPGKLESWGLGWDVLSAINPRLVMVRTTAFGQEGPYSHRPGFGTLAEAMSGFAAINGEPDGPPMLPPFALADGVASMIGAYATMVALFNRDRTGKGQMIDLAIYEPLFWLLGPQALVYDQLGVVQGRTGNRAPFTSPRNTYKAKDGRWLALSASSQSIAERTMMIIGRPDLIEKPWFSDHVGRLENQDELDEVIGLFIAERSTEEVLTAFEKGDAAIAPIYDIADIFNDPQFIERKTIVSVEHPKLGPLMMPTVIPTLSETPGSIRSCGPELGEHNRQILVEQLGYSERDLIELESDGIISKTSRRSVE